MDTDVDCPSCGAPLPAVLIHLDHAVVTMTSCVRCDQRWWTSNGEPVDPTVVFARQ